MPNFFIRRHRLSALLPILTRTRAAKKGRRRTDLQSVEGLEQRQLLVFNIQLNYSLDTSGFFADAERRATLERAADDLESRITDDLAAIQPGGVNSWSINFDHPATGQQHTIQNPVIPADTIIVYVGARPFSDRIADGGAGGFQSRGTAEWLDLVEGRGETGVIRNSSADTDTALWGGRLAFDSTTTWNFSMDPPNPGENDFYSVAAHELAHTLGVSPAADSFRRLLNTAGRFTGTTAQQNFGGPVPMFDSAHIEQGTMSRIAGTNILQEALMDPDVTVGTRKFMTELDWAILDDIGWDITPLPAPRNPTPRPDAFTMRVDGQTLSGNVLVDNGSGPDTDPDGDSLTVNTTVQSSPGQGTVILNSDGNFIYTPETNAMGTDQFTYEVNDGNGGTASAIVTILFQENQLPMAQPDSFGVAPGATLTGNLLNDNGSGSDSDADGDPLTVEQNPVVAPLKGTVLITASGNFTYTPNPDESGTDSFVYAVTDTMGGRATATVTLTLRTGTTFDFDIDGNQSLNPFQDATLIFAWMSAGTPDDTFNRFADSSGQRNNAADIQTYLDAHADLLDMDGNGRLNPFQDATLIFALLSSGTPDETLQRLIGADAASDRDSPQKIRNHFATLQSQTESSSPATTAAVFSAANPISVFSTARHDANELFDWLPREADEPQLPISSTESDLLFATDSPQAIWHELLQL